MEIIILSELLHLGGKKKVNIAHVQKNKTREKEKKKIRSEHMLSNPTDPVFEANICPILSNNSAMLVIELNK